MTSSQLDGSKRDASERPNPGDPSTTLDATVEPSKLALLALVVVVGGVYFRTFGAGFVGFDDNIHVYANPYLNPLTFENVGALWKQAYEWLYIPLAYTILAGIALFASVPPQMMSSVGQTVSLSPTAFHVASIAFHSANALFCYLLALRLTRNRTAALVCSLVFAVHPLQVESVSWISELRGLSSSFFGLAALNVLLLSRRASDRAPVRSRSQLAASSALVICAMLCKPSAVVLPLVALLLDRVARRNSWRTSIVTALTWGVCVLPFAWITKSLQDVVPAGMSVWWQRPFIAGDALAFYLLKTVVPIDLCVDHGRTPRWVMSQDWSYVIWAIPIGLWVLSYKYRQRRPMAWLGSLLFMAFLLPNLGLTPFKYQAYSTVADRYAYLPLIGIGLIIADILAVATSKVGMRAAWAGIFVFAILGCNQSSYWVGNIEFLRHTLDVNPDVEFAHNNLGLILLKEEQVDEAIGHFREAVRLEPGDAKPQNNLGLALVQRGKPDEAEPHYRKAVELDPRYFKAYENLGALYLRAHRLDAAIASLKAAVDIQPSEAKALNDLGIAYMQSEQPAAGLDAFQRAVGIEPNNARYRKNLGYALLQAGRTDEAKAYLSE